MKKPITYGAVEHTISDTLYRICILVTVIAMSMTLLRFFTRGIFPPDGIAVFYVGILALYSVHKEVLHWILDKENLRNRRRGENFVYAWILLVAAMYTINFLSRDWFTTLPNGEHLPVLNEAAFIALEVGAIFVASRIVKIVRMYVEGRLKGRETVCIGLRLPRGKKHAKK